MSESSSAAPGGPPPALLRALRRLLGPLVRLLLEHQITFPAFANLLKSVYVEEASRSFAIPGRPQTLSRLTLLTGIHRKDVKRLRDEPPQSDSVPTSISLGSQIVVRWTTDPTYQTTDGEPLALPRLARDTVVPSFESLVESLSKDIRPRAVLDEWRRLGIATIDADDHVHLVANAFVPEHGFDEKAYYLGRNIHDHLAATAHNLSDHDKPMFERSVYFPGLRAESVATLEELSSRLGMEALQRMNREARALQQADESESNADKRMRFGVYFYHETIEQDLEQTLDDNLEDSSESGQASGHNKEEGGSDAV
jgi:hypothetical protein